ncbi:cytochrome b5-related protein [Folsomia candida]|uniref:Cytochrome b5-related protein n=1 Tax=Folsomia candida TaxID=158441 RepID=A0A226DTG3_FOLCA|nr:cytochrome b5-related protein [Folsomia candida]OXA47486.1 Cytochrome b5-related protein [Folsomia candida]
MAPSSKKPGNNGRIDANSNLGYIKSSYPGLQSSGQRGKPFPNIFDWLEVKKRDDNVGPYWRVHDKLYDLDEFIAKHPGGPDWLRYSKGMDITEAFESAHVIGGGKVNQILAKYYVKDVNFKRNSPFTFKEDGFYKTLKRRVEPVLKEIGTGFSPEILRLQDSLALGYVTFALLGVWSGSKLLQILAGILLGMCSIGGHNFLHKADNWRQYYFDLSPLSSFEFRLTHHMSHHMFPNTILDFEVQTAEPLIQWLPSPSKNFVQKYLAPIYFYGLYAIFTLTQLIGRIRSIVLGKQAVRPENFIIFVEFGIIFMLSETYWAGLTASLTIVMVGSFWFVFVGFAHHHPNSFHDGDEARPDPDFGLCQLDATHGKSDNFHKPLLSILTTFGQHPMHHLFPTVCHSKLEALKPIVHQVLAEFEEKLPLLSQFELFMGAQVQMGRSKPNAWRK